MGSSRLWPCRPRGCCPCGRGGTWIAAGSRACSPAATGGCGGKSGGDDDCRQCRDCSGRCCCRDCCSPGYPRSSSGKMIQGLAPAPTTFASWRKRSPWRHHPSHGPNGRDGTPPNPPTAGLPAPPQTAGPRRVGRRERGDTGLRAARREKQTSRESVHKGGRAGMREKGRGWRGKGRVGGSSPANVCGTALVPNHGRWLPPAAHSVAIDPPPTSQPPIAGQPLPPARSADRAATSSPPAPPPPHPLTSPPPPPPAGGRQHPATHARTATPVGKWPAPQEKRGRPPKGGQQPLAGERGCVRARGREGAAASEGHEGPWAAAAAAATATAAEGRCARAGRGRAGPGGSAGYRPYAAREREAPLLGQTQAVDGGRGGRKRGLTGDTPHPPAPRSPYTTSATEGQPGG